MWPKIIEIIVGVSAALIVLGVIGTSIYRKKKHKGSSCGGDCSSCPYCCHKDKKDS